MEHVNPTSTSHDLLGDLYEIVPLTPASKGQRFANCLMDDIIATVFAAAVFICLGVLVELAGGDADTFYDSLFGYVVVYSAFIAYYTLLEAFNKGRTIGKLITKTYAVGIDSQPLTVKQAFRRSLCRIVPFEVFSGLGTAPWHDRWTGTTVVKNTPQGA